LTLTGIGAVGCQEEKSTFKLPDKIPTVKPGKVDYISPEAMIQKSNTGSNLRFYYLVDNPNDTTALPPLKSLKKVMVGELMMSVDTMSRAEPFYFMCYWGDDSRKSAIRLATSGFDCFSVDGGFFRLKKALEKGSSAK